MAAETKIDEEEAAEMLRSGERVRVVADRYGVSTQAVYLAIRQGRLPARAHGGPRGDRINGDGMTSSTSRAGTGRT